jgi:hypothetical protein
MMGFIGPADIFRNPEAIWRLNEPTDGDAPFDLVLSHSGTCVYHTIIPYHSIPFHSNDR